MKNIEKVVIPVIIITIITMLGIYYISKEYEKQQAEKRAEQMKEEKDAASEELVDSEDLVYESVAMLVGKDEQKHTLKFMAVDSDKLFELEYTGTTPILSKHGSMLTIDEIPLGEILDVLYSIHSRELYQLQVSDQAWTLTDVTKFEINEDEKRMDIAGSTYKLPKTAIVSYKNELASFMDVTNVDTLTVKGKDRKVCSIIVERGHGYVRLQNDSYFEGGWIEIGNDIVKKVTEEMLIPVPEGDYHVRLTNRGYAAEEDVTIERDKESVIDLSKVNIKEVAIGHVSFTIVPDYAQLYIDGQMTDYEDRIPLEFGIHHVHAELAGYESVDTNIRVSDKYANIEISLEKEDDKDSTTNRTSPTPTPTPSVTVSPTPAGDATPTPTPIAPLTRTAPTDLSGSTTDASTSSSSTTSTTASSSSTTAATVISNSRKMYVESPEGAEVFVDGIYIGIAPVLSMKPEAGSHVITLSKNGCVTKSYTIAVADDDNDVTLSFSDLVEGH